MDEILKIDHPLPVVTRGQNSPGWWSMWCIVATEAALFAYLLFSYFYLGSQAHGGWIPELPALRLALPNTLILIASSLFLHWAERGIRHGQSTRLCAGLSISCLLSILFFGIQLEEWQQKKFALGEHAYASSYYITTGFHMAHVLIGLFILLALLIWAVLGKFNARQHTAVSIGAVYWHFVDVVWLAVFTSFYLLPYLH